MLEANHWTEHRVSNGGVGEGSEGAEVFPHLCGEQRCQLARLPEAPGYWTTNQRVHMEGPMAPAAHVAEDGFVGPQWEEPSLGLRVFNASM